MIGLLKWEILNVVYFFHFSVTGRALIFHLRDPFLIQGHLGGLIINIKVIQVYAPISNAEEAQIEWFYEDL